MSKRIWKKSVNALLATSLVASIAVPVVPSTANAETIATDLIISEYIEGSSFNKAIEIYNGTGKTIDLSNYTLELYSNGSTTASNTLKLSGTLDNGEVYVLYHKDAIEAIKAVGDLENSTVINFNGDDALVLKNAGTVIDSIGQVGVDPGTSWGTTVKTIDSTLIRNNTILTGDTNPYDAFVPEAEWTSLGKDNFTDLGKHLNNGTPGDPETPEVISIADARALASGNATIKGIVTAKLKNTIHIQDETAAIAVRPASLDVELGDEIIVSGSLQEYRGLLQLDSATVDEKTVATVPAPVQLNGTDVNEVNESKLALVKNVELIDVNKGNGWANYTVKTEDGATFLIRDETGTLNLTVGTTYDSITGIVQQFDQDYQIIPRGQADIIEDATTVQKVYASHPTGMLPVGTEVTLSTSTIGAQIYYTTDGTEPTVETGQLYKAPITINDDMTIKAIAVKDGLSNSELNEFQYTVYEVEDIRIHDIQGESHNSPLNGTVVESVEGIVTYTYKIGSGNYFTMQTPDDKTDGNAKTSEGIVVYTGNKATAQVGNLVSVTGTVDEYHIDGYNDTKRDTDLPVTQINARDDRGGVVIVLTEKVALPTPFVITSSNLPSEVIDNDGFSQFDPQEDAIDFWESLEGMLVEVGSVKAVAPQEHGDLITVLENRETNTIHGGVLLEENNANADRIQFKMYDNYEAREFEVATGDKFIGPIQGVVNYGFQNYKIYVDLEVMEAALVKGDAEPETTTIVKEEGKLTIASYNLENFSNNTKETSIDKAQKLARAFVKDMQSPDIIGVTEVQDNNGQATGNSAANESYERLIQAIVDAGGPRYEYVNIDPEVNKDGGAPNANIRVGILYNPERVSLSKDENGQVIPVGDATTAVDYEDGSLTLNPGRIDPTNPAFNSSRKPLAAQFNFQGEEVIVIVNHWNSKSGDTPLFGSTQPPVYGSEAQRKEIAKIVYDFVENIKTENPDANIVSVGDFNDFQFSDALKIHEGTLMTNMINKVEAADRYTYLFQGNSQVLDHILVSNNLVNNTEIDILHINADFTDMAGRASDHDPVMVQINLKKTDKDDKAEKVIVLDEPRYHANKITITEPSIEIHLADHTKMNNMLVTSNYVEFYGGGFKRTKVTIKPENPGAILDFKGTEIKEVTIEGKNVIEIRNAENIKKIKFKKGASKDSIKFVN
ncbi:chitobiase/beta-hexosaminidase C-terminal domain-containing protein [Ureibacillus manganicus]|uniref:chitobiase/beta-hexosaminidase C-terminal domain-containing protein n=1 Tax=Ureibacillus manganicus TaxID=1266064 RepID=UPI00056A863A|nr:chitobiase/beta-hexosaminidase C-terminal domain-containing protein [Ureibacillus manganicus]